MKRQKLPYIIQNGPSMDQLNNSLNRVEGPLNNTDVVFSFTDTRDSSQSTCTVMIQGMERPATGKHFWKIRAACFDLSIRHNDEINTIILYNPTTQRGYMDFTQPLPSRLK